MKAWAEKTGGDGKIDFLADGSAEFAKGVDMALDATAGGLGIRSKRYSMLVDDGVVKKINVEAPGKFEVSDAETMLGQL
jgi:peroxiredoxin